MKVALYYPWVYLTSGAERTILQLTAHSRHEWTIFTNRFDKERTFPELATRDVRELAKVPVKRTIGAALWGAWRIVTERLPLERYDALVVVCEGFGDLVLFRNHSVPAVNICLTPLRLSFDKTYRRHCLAERGAAGKIAVSLGALLFRYVDRLAWRRYRRIICISEEVKRRATLGGLAKPEQIQVAHVGLGFEPGTPSDRFGSFFLLAGRIMWTKNIELGIEAFFEARKESAALSGFRLIIAGMVDRKSEPYLERLRQLAAQDPGAIEFRTRVSDHELSELYRTAYASLFTAFNEDWGIVPLESMAFGKPVVCTNSGGPREYIIDGKNGFLTAPDVKEFAGRIRQLAENPDLCRAMGLEGAATARSFSWQRFTNCIDAAVDEVVRRLPAQDGKLAPMKRSNLRSEM
jgi:glycosyltransferase involved in cell wall biosynthesis